SHPDEAGYQRFLQYVFDRQWSALKGYANERSIRILGDVPIFVADGSIDVRAHPELFELDTLGRPLEVAGVPPDLFSKTGQRWGNPLFRWEVMAQDGYRWWADRLRRTLELVDIVRIDHFRGFAAYWAIPASEPTAVKGEWRKGPGLALFRELGRQLGELPIVVEDLGLITTDVVAIRQALGYPGMKVLQFGFDGDGSNPYLPHNYSADCVVYTGTHDNDTTTSWYALLPENQQHAVRRYLGTDAHDVAWDFIRLAEASVAVLAICPAQDLLSLGNDARFNFPGHGSGNWGWRLDAPLSDELGQRLLDLTATYGRQPRQAEEVPMQPEQYPFGQLAH